MSSDGRHRRRAGAWCLVLAGAAAAASPACREVAAAAGAPDLAIVAAAGTGSRVVVEARGTSCPSREVTEGAGRRLLVLRRATAGSAPIVGTYTCERSVLRFSPAASLVAGETYVAQWLGGHGVRRLHTVPVGALPAEPLRVESVLPAAQTLPANHLRLYVTFSREMLTEDGIENRFELRRVDRGEVVAGAWRVNHLWTSDRRTLTLLFHPGRQKTDIPYARQMAPILVPGERYEIVARGLRDVHGESLRDTVVKRFTVAPADRERPSVRSMSSVTAASRDALVVEFGEALDSGRASVSIDVFRADGTRVAGQGSLRVDETALRWLPTQAWTAGSYTVRISPDLEDLAGNAPRRLFDDVAPPSRGAHVVREFVVAPAR